MQHRMISTWKMQWVAWEVWEVWVWVAWEAWAVWAVWVAWAVWEEWEAWEAWVGAWIWRRLVLFSFILIAPSQFTASLQLMAQMGDKGGAGPSGPSGLDEELEADSDSEDDGPPPLEES